ncbi:FG-GAP repeat domain-containing protein [Streptomyces sp. KL110A]|uniref:FG-GAP repeat domain-containing protein n=1 Tax=Streptomyces sp. KL110A TaxID=3384221 RepID=UPI0038C48FB3
MSRARVRARIRPSRLRLTAALAVTLAATTAATVAGPGVAAAAPAALKQEARAGAALPELSTLDSVGGVGATGFLTTQYSKPLWTRYDGTSVLLPSTDGTTYRGAPAADVVVGSKGTRHTVQDMAEGGDPVVIDSPHALRQVNGSTLVMVDDTTNTLHLVSREPGGQTVDRQVTGLPAGKLWVTSPTAPGTVAIQLMSADLSSYRLALVDVATAKVTETYDTGSYGHFVQVTPDRVAWEVAGGGTKVVDRHTKASQVLPYRAQFGLGDWVAAVEDTRLTFRSPKDGRTVEPFRFANQVTPGPEGTFLVRGGTAADGWGVFRVALGADGEPAVTMVADVPDAPELTLKSLSVPSTSTGSARISWEFSQEDPSVRFELTHTATGRTVSPSNYMNPFINWDGTLGNLFGAYNGEYTWKMSALPYYGFGPAVVRTGTLIMNRPVRPRDFNDNGGADALVRDGEGKLSAYEIRQFVGMKDTECYEEGCPPVVHKPNPDLLGTGWNTYTLMASPGNVAGGAAHDIVGRDRDGVLWLHQSEKQKLLPRTKVGGGWQIYNKIVGGSDLNGDGRGDLLATDTSGVLWLYTSTGDAKAPFKARKKIGAGWQQYNLLTAPGNIAGATGGDLLARDKDGVLWLYLGKGDGTFTARRQIGGGWQKYTHIIPAGINPKGVADLYAVGASGSAHYSGLNSTTKPFDGAYTLPVRTDSTTYKTFF